MALRLSALVHQMLLDQLQLARARFPQLLHLSALLLDRHHPPSLQRQALCLLLSVVLLLELALESVVSQAPSPLVRLVPVRLPSLPSQALQTQQSAELRPWLALSPGRSQLK